MQLIYVMDPMCAWCYGFQPELDRFLKNFPTAEVDWIMGGLAPDTNEPMSESLRHAIASYWYEIEQLSQVIFNHDYWTLNTPYRSTYQACRAVISAEQLKAKSATRMVNAIQSAYYIEAKNPSLDKTLLDCAELIGLEDEKFWETLKSEKTEKQLQHHLHITRHFQVTGFPALIYLDEGGKAYPLALGFCKSIELEERLKRIRETVG